MKISDFLTDVETLLKGAETLSDVRDIAISPGRFNADEIARRSFKAPALRIAFLGTPRTQPRADETRRYDCAFAVFVLADGKNRATEGLDICQAVAELVEVERFTDGRGVGLPRNLRMDALYSGDVDDKGVSLHSVSWVQSLRLGVSAGIATAPDTTDIVPEGAELYQCIDITFLPPEAD
ncbi:MAG: hypothetical protein CSA70_03670 [Rhodobacterales bacterium]|nr:MAG: hypothetical protein CSA70_03670 [Rhodobacterales bacterium]